MNGHAPYPQCKQHAHRQMWTALISLTRFKSSWISNNSEDRLQSCQGQEGVWFLYGFCLSLAWRVSACARLVGVSTSFSGHKGFMANALIHSQPITHRNLVLGFLTFLQCWFILFQFCPLWVPPVYLQLPWCLWFFSGSHQQLRVNGWVKGRRLRVNHTMGLWQPLVPCRSW